MKCDISWSTYLFILFILVDIFLAKLFGNDDFVYKECD